MNTLNDVKLNVPELGELSMIDVLIFYDAPRVFITQDKFNTFYLFQETIDDEIKTEWLVIKISSNRRLQIKTNQITLQDAFRQSEEQKYYLISEYDEPNKVTIESHIALSDNKITAHNSYVGIDYICSN